MSGTKAIWTFSCFLAISFSSALVQAAPLHYDESVSGDIFVDLNFGAGHPLPTTLAFDVGTNTVSGSMQIGDPPFLFDTDSFAFIIPDGAVLESTQITLVDTIGNMSSIVFHLLKGSANWQIGTLIDSPEVPSPGASDFENMPQPSGLYQLVPFIYGYGSPPGFGGVNYEMTFVVVPEPSGLVLATLGLIGLAVWRLRRR